MRVGSNLAVTGLGLNQPLNQSQHLRIFHHQGTVSKAMSNRLDDKCANFKSSKKCQEHIRIMKTFECERLCPFVKFIANVNARAFSRKEFKVNAFLLFKANSPLNCVRVPP